MERLQKVLAAAGVASRRKCEEFIAAGRVAVNGTVVKVQGVKVCPGDRITVDGKEIERSPAYTYYLLNKPPGYVTTVSDPQGRPTVMDLLPAEPRVFPVGRLDLDTAGLLLVTNDGDLTNALLHPSREVEKIYRAVVLGQVAEESLAQLARGVLLADGLTAPAKVRLLKRTPLNTVLTITIHQGRKRQVKRMLEAVGNRVTSLQRTEFAFLTLAGVERGKYRRLSRQEILGLKNLAKKEGQKRQK